MHRSEDTREEEHARDIEHAYHRGWNDAWRSALAYPPNWTPEDARRAAIECGLIEPEEKT